MDREQRIQVFAQLGRELNEGLTVEGSLHWDRIKNGTSKAYAKNGWFEPEQVELSLREIVRWLDEQSLRAWVAEYEVEEENPKTIGVIAAGNIPVVAFHDLLSVLISGHKLLIKCSSDDDVLIPMLMDMLIDIEPGITEAIQLADGMMKEADAFIGTGSDNTSRYFEYYFKGRPNIIRKNRHAIAILNGHETEDELKNLGHDVFQYYGLGCRNVTKLFLPKGYDLNRIFRALFEWKHVLENNKYKNNYEYYRTIYLLNKEELLDNGFLILRKAKEIASSIGVLHYEFYEDIEDVISNLRDNSCIQCLVGSGGLEFGTAQQPSISDYADGVDTMAFLRTIHTGEQL